MSNPFPPLSAALANSADLNGALSILFEPSQILTERLVPQLSNKLASTLSPPTYSAVVDLAIEQLGTWPALSRAEFIESHPRIGEVKGLSALSAKEQATVATDPSILARLKHLNLLYETRFTGLRFVVFVDGRTRAEIVPVMEAKLAIGPSEPGHEFEPSVDSVIPLDAGDKDWETEVDRAVHDVGLIAKARLRGLGLD